MGLLKTGWRLTRSPAEGGQARPCSWRQPGEPIGNEVARGGNHEFDKASCLEVQGRQRNVCFPLSFLLFPHNSLQFLRPPPLCPRSPTLTHPLGLGADKCARGDKVGGRDGGRGQNLRRGRRQNGQGRRRLCGRQRLRVFFGGGWERWWGEPCIRQEDEVGACAVRATVLIKSAGSGRRPLLAGMHLK